MISYNLCNQLKKAGFPQHEEEASKGVLIKGSGFDNETTINGRKYLEDCYVPTLSELIKECGDRFKLLNRAVDGEIWVAEDSEEDIDKCVNLQIGGTPEESVAKLWLKLNKK